MSQAHQVFDDIPQLIGIWPGGVPATKPDDHCDRCRCPLDSREEGWLACDATASYEYELRCADCATDEWLEYYRRRETEHI